MNLSDEIGKLIAVAIIAPIMIYKGFIYNDLLLGILGLLLFVYDSYFICKYYSKKHNLAKKETIIDVPENIILEVIDK